MTFLALLLVAIQLLTAALSAVRLFQRYRREPDTLPQSLHLLAPGLLGTSVLPLVPLLASHAPAVLWGLWGAGYISAALVYATADTVRDIPRTRPAPPASPAGAD